MARRFFGTDGVRGVANEKLTPDFAFQLGLATGRWLIGTGARTRAVIGRDTRRSGPMLGAALASGLCSVGVDVITLGVAPTPTISFVARTGDFGLGGIVSASHNPAPDNGIKFVGHDGCKLPDAIEEQIEALIGQESARPSGAGVGCLDSDRSGISAYLDMLVEIVPEGLSGLRVAVDAANGAAHELGPEVLRRLGADIVVVGNAPDGMNINAVGGATKPHTIQRLTVDSGADVGVAFDGDADRAVFSDEKGALINGDRTIGAWAVHKQKAHELEPAIAVGTVMSNGGFEAFLRAQGICLERTPVGDKYVAQRISETGAQIGGEQSGHIIFPRRGPTGDGLITMLEFLRVIKLEGRPASSFSADYDPWPQLLVNVGVRSTEGWKAALADVLAAADEQILGHGRVLVRPSGTQPMIRVMVEADSYPLRDDVTAKIVSALENVLGGEVHGRVDLTHALGD